MAFKHLSNQCIVLYTTHINTYHVMCIIDQLERFHGFYTFLTSVLLLYTTYINTYHVLLLNNIHAMSCCYCCCVQEIKHISYVVAVVDCTHVGSATAWT